MPKTEKPTRAPHTHKPKAYHMYVTEGLAPKVIRETLGLREATLRNWVNKGKWREDRAEFLVRMEKESDRVAETRIKTSFASTRENFLSRLPGLISKATDLVERSLESDPDARTAKQAVDALKSLVSTASPLLDIATSNTGKQDNTPKVQVHMMENHR